MSEKPPFDPSEEITQPPEEKTQVVREQEVGTMVMRLRGEALESARIEASVARLVEIMHKQGWMHDTLGAHAEEFYTLIAHYLTSNYPDVFKAMSDPTTIRIEFTQPQSEPALFREDDQERPKNFDSPALTVTTPNQTIILTDREATGISRDFNKNLKNS